MWNANVHQYGADQDLSNFQNYQNYEDFGSTGEYQTSEASFDDFNHPNTSHYDPFPSYAHNPEYAMPAARRPARNVLSQHSANAVPLARGRQSAQSVAASSIVRPPSAYTTDSNFYVNSGAMSPISTMGHLFPGQDPYSSESNEFLDFTGVGNSAVGSPPVSDEENSGSDSLGDAPPRSHHLYHVLPSEDGYYHCPYVATENCGHEPKQLKCEYDKHIDSHLKPFRCKSSKCSDQKFSSTACLLRHEREAHDMHGHAESLCEYPPCNRSQPGEGFRRSYNCKDHMTRCHGWVETSPTMDKKRRSTHSSGSGKNGVNKNKGPSKKSQIAKLKQEWAEHKALMEQLSRNLAPDGPLMNMQITQIQHEAQLLASISVALSKLTSRG